ncbi:hypothetical protein ACFQV8_06595 [Pseudonocardia benzenivorans]
MRRWGLVVLAGMLLLAGCSAGTPAPPSDPFAIDERPATAGFYGELHRPPGATDDPIRRPAVLVVGGAEGGLALDPLAAALARKGFVSLAVGYFGLPGLPPTLREIPLEYFATALRVLAAQPGVDPARIVVWGPPAAARSRSCSPSTSRRSCVASSPTPQQRRACVQPVAARGGMDAGRTAGALGVGRAPGRPPGAGRDDRRRRRRRPDPHHLRRRRRALALLFLRRRHRGPVAARDRARLSGGGAHVRRAAPAGVQAPGVAARVAAAGGRSQANTDAAIDAFDRAVRFIAGV